MLYLGARSTTWATGKATHRTLRRLSDIAVKGSPKSLESPRTMHFLLTNQLTFSYRRQNEMAFASGQVFSSWTNLPLAYWFERRY